MKLEHIKLKMNEEYPILHINEKLFNYLAEVIKGKASINTNDEELVNIISSVVEDSYESSIGLTGPNYI